MTSQTLIEQALRLVTPIPLEGTKVSVRTALGVLIPVAIAEVTTSVRDDPRWKDALTRTFTVTAAAGTADITTILGQGLAPDALYNAELYHSSSPYQMEWMPDLTTLRLLARAGFLGVAQEGVTLYFSDVSGALGTLAGTVTIKAVGVPVTAAGVIDIPVRLEALLTETLARLVSEKVAA